MTIAAAYHYAENGGGKPNDLELLTLIDRFGVVGVLGRPVLTALEIRKMLASENIVDWYNERRRASHWDVWTETNPAKAEWLAVAYENAVALIPEFNA